MDEKTHSPQAPNEEMGARYINLQATGTPESRLKPRNRGPSPRFRFAEVLLIGAAPRGVSRESRLAPAMSKGGKGDRL